MLILASGDKSLEERIFIYSNCSVIYTNLGEVYIKIGAYIFIIINITCSSVCTGNNCIVTLLIIYNKACILNFQLPKHITGYVGTDYQRKTKVAYFNILENQLMVISS